MSTRGGNCAPGCETTGERDGANIDHRERSMRPVSPPPCSSCNMPAEHPAALIDSVISCADIGAHSDGLSNTGTTGRAAQKQLCEPQYRPAHSMGR